MQERTHFRMLAIDPALRNVGLAFLRVDLVSLAVEVEDLKLIKTQNEATKTVRKSSDDLRAAKQIFEALHMYVSSDIDIVAAEIPQGTQSARGAMSNGISLGLMAALAHLFPFIEVSAAEVKKIATGRSNATKNEMIFWASGKFPKAPWLYQKRKGVSHLIDANEHMADAVAIGHAALATPAFRSAVNLMRRASGSHH